MKTEFLQNLSNILIAIGVAMTAFGGLGAYYFGKRFEKEKGILNDKVTESMNKDISSLLVTNRRLEKQLLPFISYAKSLYPSDSTASALKKLQNDLSQTKSDFDKEKNRVGSILSKVKVKFSGTWGKTNSYDVILVSQPNLNTFQLGSTNKNIKPIELYSPLPFNFETINSTSAYLTCEQYIEPNAFILGQDLKSLINYNLIYIFIPFFNYNNFIDKKINIENIEIELNVNSIYKASILVKNSETSDIQFFHDDKSFAWAAVSVKLKKGIYNILRNED